jgi:hypothetical protein
MPACPKLPFDLLPVRGLGREHDVGDNLDQANADQYIHRPAVDARPERNRDERKGNQLGHHRSRGMHERPLEGWSLKIGGVIHLRSRPGRRRSADEVMREANADQTAHEPVGKAMSGDLQSHEGPQKRQRAKHSAFQLLRP